MGHLFAAGLLLLAATSIGPCAGAAPSAATINREIETLHTLAAKEQPMNAASSMMLDYRNHVVMLNTLLNTSKTVILQRKRDLDAELKRQLDKLSEQHATRQKKAKDALKKRLNLITARRAASLAAADARLQGAQQNVDHLRSRLAELSSQIPATRARLQPLREELRGKKLRYQVVLRHFVFQQRLLMKMENVSHVVHTYANGFNDPAVDAKALSQRIIGAGLKLLRKPVHAARESMRQLVEEELTLLASLRSSLAKGQREPRNLGDKQSEVISTALTGQLDQLKSLMKTRYALAHECVSRARSTFSAGEAACRKLLVLHTATLFDAHAKDSGGTNEIALPEESDLPVPQVHRFKATTRGDADTADINDFAAPDTASATSVIDSIASTRNRLSADEREDALDAGDMLDAGDVDDGESPVQIMEELSQSSENATSNINSVSGRTNSIDLMAASVAIGGSQPKPNCDNCPSTADGLLDQTKEVGGGIPTAALSTDPSINNTDEGAGKSHAANSSVPALMLEAVNSTTPTSGADGAVNLTKSAANDTNASISESSDRESWRKWPSPPSEILDLPDLARSKPAAAENAGEMLCEKLLAELQSHQKSSASDLPRAASIVAECRRAHAKKEVVSDNVANISSTTTDFESNVTLGAATMGTSPIASSSMDEEAARPAGATAPGGATGTATGGATGAATAGATGAATAGATGAATGGATGAATGGATGAATGAATGTGSDEEFSDRGISTKEMNTTGAVGSESIEGNELTHSDVLRAFADAAAQLSNAASTGSHSDLASAVEGLEHAMQQNRQLPLNEEHLESIATFS